jgi:hypothetical protein
VCPRAKRGNHCVAGYLTLALNWIQSPDPSRLANGGASASRVHSSGASKRSTIAFSFGAVRYPPTVEAACPAESAQFMFAITDTFPANQCFSAGQLHSRE